MGLKIPRSKGRAGSIPASGTKQIKGLHEILRAGPLFFVPQFWELFRNSPFSTLPLASCQSTKPKAHTTAKHLVSDTRSCMPHLEFTNGFYSY